MSHLLARREEIDIADLQHEPRRALRLLLPAAEAGDGEAQALLAQALLDGHGIQQDAALARIWFAIASRAGHHMATNMLGRCHEHGWGGPVDLNSAAKYYRQAAERGLDWAMYNLANLLATGRGVVPDQGAAFAWYQRAAERGHAKSMNLLGRYYEEGLVVAPDRDVAHDWYRRSAEAGDFRGQFSHACVLAEQGHIAAAGHWLRLALVAGNLNFLRVARHALLNSPHAAIRALADDYFARAAQLGNAEDHAALLAHLQQA